MTSIPAPPQASIYPIVDANQRRRHTGEVTLILVSGSNASVDLLLAQEWAFSFRDPDHNRSMLHIAAKAGTARCVEKMLAMGFDPNEQDGGKWTPLMLAARTFNEATVEALLRAGADPHYMDTQRRSILHHAAGVGGSGPMRLLLKAGASVDAQDTMGNTPLHMAAGSGHVGNVEALIDAGANVHIKNKSGYTPFRVAMREGHERPSLLLASVGGSKEVDAAHAKKKSMARIATDSPFRCAVLMGGFNSLRRSLELFPDIEKRDLNWAKKRYESDDNGAEDRIAFLTAHIAHQRIANLAKLSKTLPSQGHLFA